jgi:Na+-translocating ferredoxin:NAD+ oxidoreductase subunit C
MSHVLNTNIFATHAPCIRCGACEPACPEKLHPEQLHFLLNHQAIDQAVQSGLERCTLCKRCDAVCPSNIPLANQFAHALKQRQSEADDLNKTAQAKHRFEARTVRLQRIKQQRAEQHAQRAKQTTSADAIAAALARAKARKENKGDGA